MTARNTPVTERFWAKVDKSGDCWLWVAAHTNDGYGQMQIERRRIYAHRFSYENTHGPIPPGMCVCHTCDNPRCVRPDHLFLGTHKQNLEDMARKGRSNRGSKHHNAKLTETDIPIILQRITAGETQTAVSRDYGVTLGTINGIATGRWWKHAQPDFKPPDITDF